MPPKIRIILAVTFTGLFLMLVPPLVLYANGYRYDIKHQRVVKTGNLLVDSLPRGALISLDGKMRRAQWVEKLTSYKKIFGLVSRHGPTPSLIDNLLPDTYTVKITKPEYQEWKKKVEIHSGMTTSVKTVQLFLVEPEVRFLDEGEIFNWFLSPSGNKMIYRICQVSPALFPENCWVKLFNREKELISTLEELSNLSREEWKINNLEWAPGEDKIFFSFQNGPAGDKYFIYDLSSKELGDPADIFAGLRMKKILKLKWASTPNVLLARVANTIYSLNLSSLSARSIFTQNAGEIQDWIIEGKIIDILNLNKGKLLLERYELKDFNTLANRISPDRYQEIKPISQTELPNLPLKFLPYLPPRDLRFLQTKGKIIICEEDPLEKEATLITLRAKKILPFKEKYKYFFYNDYELWVLSFSKTSGAGYGLQKEIINRFSKPLVAASIHPSQNYLIYADSSAKGGDSIWTLGLDGAGSHNLTKILETSKINEILLASSPGFIYVLGEIDGKEGLFSLKIQ